MALWLAKSRAHNLTKLCVSQAGRRRTVSHSPRFVCLRLFCDGMGHGVGLQKP